MQADAQTTEPTAAEMDAALVFTADGYSDADGVDHVIKAVRAVSAAETVGADPIPAKAQSATDRAVRQITAAHREVQSAWVDRPAKWTPFSSWPEGVIRWVEAKQRWSDTFRADRRAFQRYLNDPATPSGHVDCWTFSRSLDEALAKGLPLPDYFVAARRAHEAACDALEVARLRLTQTPASGHAILAKLRLITEQMDDVFDPLEADDVGEAHAGPDMFPQANEFFGLHDDIVRAVAVPSREQNPWNAAKAEYDAALSRLTPIVAADAAATMAINRQAPIELQARRLFQDFSSRWISENALDDDPLITPAERQRLRPIVSSWSEERSRLLEKKFSGVDNEVWEKLHDDVDEASTVLLETVPPDLAALVEQQRIAAERVSGSDTDWHGGFADLGWVSFKEASYWTDRPATMLHRHLLRLAGVDHPMLHMEPFSPRDWIRAYEEAGGLVSHTLRGLVLTIPDDDVLTETLRAQLAGTPWRYWAVNLTASARREEGGDPICDNVMGWGPKDRRGGIAPFKGPVLFADVVEFSPPADVGSPQPHVFRIDNRGHE